MKRNTKVFLVIGGALLTFFTAIAAVIFILFYFHVLNMGYIVSGN